MINKIELKSKKLKLIIKTFHRVINNRPVIIQFDQKLQIID